MFNVSIIVDMKYLLSIIALTLSLNAQGIPDHPPGQGENRRKPPEISKEFREKMIMDSQNNWKVRTETIDIIALTI